MFLCAWIFMECRFYFCFIEKYTYEKVHFRQLILLGTYLKNEGARTLSRMKKVGNISDGLVTASHTR